MWDMCGREVGVMHIYGWVAGRVRIRIRASGGGQFGRSEIGFRHTELMPD